MNTPVTKLEEIAKTTAELLTIIERDIAIIKSNYATKADVSDAKASIIMWVVSAIFLAQLLQGLLKQFGLSS